MTARRSSGFRLNAHLFLPRAVQRWFRALTADKDPAAAELLVANTFSFPPDFKLSDFSGLLACQLIFTTDGHRRVLVIWRNRKALELRQDALAAQLGAAPSWIGDVADVKGLSAWRPSSANDLILKVSAAIGAFTVIVGVLTSWFAAPDVAFAVREPLPLNATVGEPFQFGLLAFNNSRTTAADVKLSANASPPNWIKIGEPRLTVPGGGQATVSVQGTLHAAQLLPLIVSAETRAGRFIPAHHDQIDVQIRVWPPLSYESFSVDDRKTTSHVAFLNGAVLVGELAQALECQATVPDVPVGVRFLSAVPSLDGGRAQASRGAERLTVSIGWRTVIRRRYEWQFVRLNLDSEQARSSADWMRIATKLRWLCEVQHDSQPK